MHENFTSSSKRDSRPLVAVTATMRLVEGVERVRLNAAYIRSLEAAGLVPLVIPPLADADAAIRVLDAVAGLVLTGGEDVDPSQYGEAARPELGPVNCTRDVTELALLAAARERALPTLAICRGIQVVNVGLGGTLVQDLPSQQRDALPHELSDDRGARVHEVHVDPSSRLASIVGAQSLGVNSIHHQAVAEIGDALRVSARADDGVIEGVESADSGWWMVGVQWHPEELTTTPEPWDRRLFAAFAEACRARLSSGSTSLPFAPVASASPATGGEEREARR
ncbi:MAG TPA: gamma-glutamyl-gamma-aminobutyrate hydrolase family protein [Gemmatimonadaceae bacterium]|nr:gamma-glutamyl-gamma-aminobutyrate hydrolase family protein [Gemmatimonadaceae bacterium]